VIVSQVGDELTDPARSGSRSSASPAPSSSRA